LRFLGIGRHEVLKCQFPAEALFRTRNAQHAVVRPQAGSSPDVLVDHVPVRGGGRVQARRRGQQVRRTMNLFPGVGTDHASCALLRCRYATLISRRLRDLPGAPLPLPRPLACPRRAQPPRAAFVAAARLAQRTVLPTPRAAAGSSGGKTARPSGATPSPQHARFAPATRPPLPTAFPRVLVSALSLRHPVSPLAPRFSAIQDQHIRQTASDASLLLKETAQSRQRLVC
jgi:hypothetical protein